MDIATQACSMPALQEIGHEARNRLKDKKLTKLAPQ
jgi:hypothetical protein